MRQNWWASSSELFDIDDSDLSSTAFPGGAEPKAAKLDDESAAVALPEGDLRAKGTNSAAFGFKLFALPMALRFLSLARAPWLDKLILLSDKKIKELYMHKRKL